LGLSSLLKRVLVSAVTVGVAALTLSGVALAGPPAVRISDLVPATGTTVPAGQPVEVSGFIETDNGIGMAGDKPDVVVKIDGQPVSVEFAVGSKALNVGFRAMQTFSAGTHTLSVTARDYQGHSASAESKFGAGAQCRFVLGFATLQRQISDIVGRCVTDEFVDSLSGDTLQLTTGPDGNGGLMVYRKSDNFLAFTDGYRTWIYGPRGVERPRLNTERYPWEKERLTPKALREGTYKLPVGPNGAEMTLKLVNGKASFTNPINAEMPKASVTLPESSVWYGDFDGDSYRDAVVVLSVGLGGPGEDLYAVAVRDVNGQPVQVATELLGNRVRINGVALGRGEFRVDMLTQGPNDLAINPTQRVVKVFGVKLP